MQHLLPAQPTQRLPLHSTTATRRIEQAAMAGLPPHTLMQRAARAVCRLGQALYPHARHVWFACGPGNNGGDGLLAAAYWQEHAQHTGTRVTVTWTGHEQQLPHDARYALEQARWAGVEFATTPPTHPDLCIDALLGLGIHNTTRGLLAEWAALLQASSAPVLCVDLPSGLNPDSGQWFNTCPTLPQGPRHTLTLLTLKPGLFSAAGREATGDLWWDDLETLSAGTAPDAWLYTPPPPSPPRQLRHNAHKGDHGDVLVFGGQDIATQGQGMTGAALLAARAALRSGAGRVYVGLLGANSHPSITLDPLYPELMFRDPTTLLHTPLLTTATTVCGCGGGMAVKEVLPHLLEHSARLVLDADGLNAVSERDDWQTMLRQRQQSGQSTVLTPHPLEAARLLKQSTQAVQTNRLDAAQQLADLFQCVAVLKGSGSVVAAPNHTPMVHGTGNALLATAGTGDVLAGMIGNQLGRAHSSHATAFESTCLAVHQHGEIASRWQGPGFSASGLVQALHPQ
jgi:ADP-dependent NAD(P)H-hydrate dehydratase / NAD(P)H-hydrate epimerase